MRPEPTIVVDVHEGASGIPEALVRSGCIVEATSLRIGDYLVGAGTIVERKSVPDLHGSILTGRFWPQLGALKAGCRSPYLLVEGRSLDAGPLHPNAVRGVCLAVVEMGVPLLRTEDQDDSARWLHRLAVRRHRLGSSPDRPAYAQRSKAVTDTAAAEAALAAVPGISVVGARALLAAFGSVSAVSQANVDELMTVPGIGPERARTLERILGSRRADTTQGESHQRLLI